jgi:tRNA uridine 5-carboxymethylaminomethyl modification enzyme
LKTESLYKPFKERYQQDLELYNAESEVLIPDGFDYTNIASLSNEVKNKLLQFRPRNIAEAKRIQGITPAAIVAIQIHMKKYAVN